MVFGTFDIIHPGHLYFLKQAREQGNYLIIVVAKDETVKILKGRAPLNNEKERQKNLKNTNAAEKVVLGGKGDKYNVIRRYSPNCICLGYDQKFFIDSLEKEFPKISIIRLKAFRPNIYKSSLLKSKI